MLNYINFLKENSEDDVMYNFYDWRSELEYEMISDFAHKVEKWKIENGAIYDEENEKWNYDDIVDEKRYEFEFPYRQDWKKIKFETLRNIYIKFSTVPEKIGLSKPLLKTFDKILNIIRINTLKIDINTEYTGHQSSMDEDLLNDYNLTIDDCFKFYGDYCEDDALGQMRISDYGLEKLINNLFEILKNDNYYKKFMYMDQLLAVVHMRSDIADWYVEGGSESLSKISGYLREE